MNKLVEDKIKGLIFGQAIGDAYGLGTEFMTKAQVRENYPNGYHHYDQIVQDKHRARWAKGSWTDDTDQFICILQSLIENKKINELDIATKFKYWLDNNGIGVGQSTYRVLMLPEYVRFPKKGAEILWKLSNKKIASNGGLMRNGIVCTFQYWDIDSVRINCENVCKLTHFDQRCVDSCKVMAEIILGELNQMPLSWNSLTQAIKDYDDRISEYIKPPQVVASELSLDESTSLGYTLKTLNAGIWSYYNSSDFEKTLKDIVMQGGDADTNGSVVGSILGAKFGYEQLPKKLIEGLVDRQKLEALSDEYIFILKKWCNGF